MKIHRKRNLNKGVSFISLILASTSLLSFTSIAMAEGEALSEGENLIEEIIVMGEKSAKTLHETASSIRVITSDLIEKEDIKDIYEVMQRSVNVGEKRSRGGFVIRGIDAFGVSGSGNSYLASMYLDGAALPRRAIAGGALSMWDIGQVELLRGPQSTLQGKNALAGSIILRSKEPTYETEAKAQVTIGNHGNREFAVAAGTSLIEDQLAIRVSGRYNDFDGYVYNPVQKINFDYEKDRSARVKLLFEPKGIEGFKATLTYFHDDFENGDGSSDSREDNPLTNPLNFTNDLTYNHNNLDLVNLEISYEINDDWSVYSATSYNHNKYNYEWDSDGGAEAIGTLYDEQHDKTFNQELRFNYTSDKFQGLVGSFYSNLDKDEAYGGKTFYSLAELGMRDTLITAFGLPGYYADYVISLYSDVDPLPVQYTAAVTNKVSNYAIFSDFTYDITENLSLIGGFRFDREKQYRASELIPSMETLNILPDPADYDPTTAAVVTGVNGQIAGLLSSAAQEDFPVEDSFGAFLPKFGLSYRWTDDLTTSLIVQKAYRSGGVSTNIARAETYSFDKETAWNYEFSLRSKWLDGDLTVNANAYYNDWTDMQTSIQLSSNKLDTETQNAGSSHSYGFEIETFYYASEELEFYAGLGYSKTEIDDFEVTIGDVTYNLKGRAFPYAPTWSANFGGTYRNQEGLFVNVNGNYYNSAKALLNPYIVDTTDDSAEGRFMLNSRIGYEADNFNIYFFVKNIFDTKFVQVPTVYDYTHTVGARRTFGFTVQVEI